MKSVILLTYFFFASHLHAEDSLNIPINQYTALNILAKFKISTAELPNGTGDNQDGLIGDDLNKNTIRDDFERALLSTYQQPEFVAMGVLASIKWSQLFILDLSSTVDQNHSELLALTMDNLAIDACYEQLVKAIPMLQNPKTSFFNTPVRQQAKQQIEQQIRKRVPVQSFQETHYKHPCDVFKVLIEDFPIKNQPIEIYSMR
ncbi:hypothetical protein C9I98_09825 [Photobacterium sanctipauli]|uniref:Uncharacterized protein n=1 Tax=Photobacterium sanctipauli TaxID=1342794 RepID=A0A2T3NVS8_9GAMM|nr:hypothetical protein [Photobacterium sanctipauli]PSW20338.1 hypothetical protein C9I98_09825 [Photobacterium sanctipauli]